MNAQQLIAAAIGERKRCQNIVHAQRDVAYGEGKFELASALDIIADEIMTGARRDPSTALYGDEDGSKEEGRREEGGEGHASEEALDEEEREALGLLGRVRVEKQFKESRFGLPRD